MKGLSTMSSFSLMFWKSQSTLVTVLQIVMVLSLVISITFCFATIGVFGSKYKEFHQKQADDWDGDDHCMLYTSLDNILRLPNLGKDSYCDFVVYGQSAVAVLLVAISTLLAVIVFFRFHVGLVIFSVAGTVSFTLAFSATVVLSNGFVKTCDSIKESTGIRCSEFKFPSLRELTTISFYTALEAATACSWIETAAIGIVCLIAFLYMAILIMKKSGGYQSLT